MNRYRLLLVVVCLLTCAFCTEPLYLLGSPRSGTYWLAYILQGLTRRPVEHDGILFENPHLKRIICPKLPSIVKTHLCTNVQRHPQAKLIFILRNHRECQLRHRKLEIKKAVPEFIDLAKSNGMYFKNIHFFESWSPDKRHFVFYEDLMLNPEQEILKLARFLETPDILVKRFIDRLDEHIRCSYQLKQKKKIPLPTMGRDKLVYYSKKIPSTLNHLMDDAVRKHQPVIWEKYLKRYEWLDPHTKHAGITTE